MSSRGGGSGRRERLAEGAPYSGGRPGGGGGGNRRLYVGNLAFEVGDEWWRVFSASGAVDVEG